MTFLVKMRPLNRQPARALIQRSGKLHSHLGTMDSRLELTLKNTLPATEIDEL